MASAGAARSREAWRIEDMMARVQKPHPIHESFPLSHAWATPNIGVLGLAYHEERLPQVTQLLFVGLVNNTTANRSESGRTLVKRWTEFAMYYLY